MSPKKPLTIDDLPEDSEDHSPEGIKGLFGGKIKLSRVTETPGEMVFPMIVTKLLAEAVNPKRIADNISLVEILRDEFDDRMISYQRKGRIEGVEIYQALAARQAELDEEDAIG